MLIERNVKMATVRTRFAPSPTGYMHIGNLRTALYAYLLAKKNNGSFVLRIEDTDQQRYVEGAVDLIYRTLAETGLIHDEGPDKDGGYGPYIQSERREIYKEYAQKLVDMGAAYYCFCDKERLDSLHASDGSGVGGKYDKHCLHLSKEEIQQKLDAGVPYVIRQNIPETGVTTFKDEVFGEITVENSILDDNVLLKSDGLPTYNFANVVDDHLMNITHVIRGSEYLSSTPKYNLLYEAFGWEIPTYIHVSPVMRDAQHKLSKRDGDASYEDFIKSGFLKDALINYVALLGWSPGAEQEIFTLDELIQEFDVKGISKSPAVFDEKKLRWMNSEYIRALSPDEFGKYAKPYYDSVLKAAKIDYNKLNTLLQGRTEVFPDILEKIDFMETMPEYDNELYVNKKMKTTPETSLPVLQAILPVLEGVENWCMEELHDKMMALVEQLGMKNGQVLYPLRVALSGKLSTPGGGVELADLFGKDETIKRLKMAIDKLS